ncbi:hypothetical protein BKA00_006626 [Actinomadura coerulea]|uniref:AP2-like integrase N-terminal domain-containing protein n=1 Tax=Actinomadura coerulea TaxID=46159 RepID=A0A7X0G6S1_9ACTN|nr:hypothetical protein [Actinomadura coerulea]MBB6399712.1 hypothetical protein [Actinomadura coerulea]
MATHVRKRGKRKWWVLEIGTDKPISGPHDTKEEAEKARDAAKS